MSRKKGVVFSAEQKTKIVLELLKEEQTISQLATEYGVTAKSIHNWKSQFLANASLAFEPAKVVSEHKEELKAKEAEIENLQKALGKTIIERDWVAGKLKSSVSLNDKKALVETELKSLSLTRQCELLHIGRSALYYQPRPISGTTLVIMHTIDEIYTDNSGYGYNIGKERVLKYMNLMGISAIYPKKKKLTSIKHLEYQTHPCLLKDYWAYNNSDRTKSVYVPEVNEVWRGDITYIRMNGGFMYLAVIIDWHSKAVLSCKISNSMDAILVTCVLQEAIANYGTPKIFNSDQGAQHTSHEHTQILKDNGIQISVNGKGRNIDNITIERFFRTLKHKNIYINDYQNIKGLKEGVKNYIHKYNFKRFHSSIGCKQPMNYYLEMVKKAA